MNPLQAFMVTGYATTGAGLCALAAWMPDYAVKATLLILAGVCFWRAHYWFHDSFHGE